VRLRSPECHATTSVDELLEQCPSLPHVEDVSVSSGRPPEVDRPEGSAAVILTFRGTREQKVRDRDTRIRIALQGPQAVRLWRLLGERLTDVEKTGD
jgi:hypothetical protein